MIAKKTKKTNTKATTKKGYDLKNIKTKKKNGAVIEELEAHAECEGDKNE